jgi:hypothetical protein
MNKTIRKRSNQQTHCRLLTGVNISDAFHDLVMWRKIDGIVTMFIQF